MATQPTEKFFSWNFYVDGRFRYTIRARSCRAAWDVWLNGWVSFDAAQEMTPLTTCVFGGRCF